MKSSFCNSCKQVGKQVPACSTRTVYLDHGLPIAYCDVTGERLEFGDWMHKGEDDIGSLAFDRLEEEAKKGWGLIEYPADLKSDLPQYRPCIDLRARADGTVDSGRAANAALAFRTKSGVALGKCCEKFGLHMSEQRLGQIHKQYAVPDPCREEIDHSLTENLTRVAGQRLCDTWKAHGRPPQGLPHACQGGPLGHCQKHAGSMRACVFFFKKKTYIFKKKSACEY